MAILLKIYSSMSDCGKNLDSKTDTFVLFSVFQLNKILLNDKICLKNCFFK